MTPFTPNNTKIKEYIRIRFSFSIVLMDFNTLVVIQFHISAPTFKKIHLMDQVHFVGHSLPFLEFRCPSALGLVRGNPYVQTFLHVNDSKRLDLLLVRALCIRVILPCRPNEPRSKAWLRMRSLFSESRNTRVNPPLL